eukprot:924090-Pyramimonas_sp.AAC.1
MPFWLRDCEPGVSYRRDGSPQERTAGASPRGVLAQRARSWRRSDSGLASAKLAQFTKGLWPRDRESG